MIENNSSKKTTPQISFDICGCVLKICVIFVLMPTQLNAQAALGEEAPRVPETIGRKAFTKSLAHYTQGLIYDTDTKVEKAVKEYSEALKYDNSQPNVHLRLGIDYVIIGQYKKAIEALKYAKRLNPDDIRPRILLALVYTGLKDLASAKKEYEDVIKIKPENINASSSLADLYVVEQKFKEAIGIYEELLKKHKGKSDEAMLHFNLGIIYARMQRFDDAIVNLEDAARLEPGYLQAYLALGLLYEAKKNQQGAIKTYEEVLKKDPRNKDARRLLGNIYIEQKKPKEAIRQFEALIRIDPDETGAYIDLAGIYLKMDNTAGAKKVISEAKEAGIKDAKIYLIEGIVYSQNNLFKEAIEAYKKALAIEPKNSLCNFYMGAAHERLGEKKEAVFFLKEAIGFDKNNAEAYNYLGYMYAEDGIDLDEAIGLIKKALEIDPENGAFLDSLGWAYFKKGWAQKAVVELEKSLKFVPKDPTIHDHLGDAYFREGRIKKARVEWRKSLKFDPKQEKVRKKLEK